MGSLSPKHHLFCTVPEINELCAPLFKATTLTFFNYARAYHNGLVAGLFTHPQWLLHTINKKLAPSVEEFCRFKQYTLFGSQISTSVLAPKKYQTAVRDFNELFGLDYLLCINQQHDEYYEAFAFATRVNNSAILEFYLNNRELLEKFILFFKEKGADLITRANKSCNLIARIDTVSKKLTVTTNFKNRRKYYLVQKNGKKVSLSRREIECLRLILKGRTAKEIGNFMRISAKTVEAHIYNIKIKLGCHRKSELIDIGEFNFF